MSRLSANHAPEPTGFAVHESGTLGSIILNSIRRFPDKVAIGDGTISWTYAELGNAIGRCLAIFRQLGLQRGDGIAMAAGNRAEQVAAQYAALLLGARYTALHLLSARDVHDFVLNDARISVLIIDPDLPSARDGDFRTNVPGLRHVLSFGPMDGCLDLVAKMQETAAAPLVDQAVPGDVAYLFYTGGTTGRPKGVCLAHRSLALATLIQSCDWDLPTTENRFLAATPTSHASGIIVPTILMRGGYVRLLRGFDAAKFCCIVEEEKINCSFLVPTMIYVLLDEFEATGRDLSSLETIIYGAAPMSPERLRQAIDAFGSIFVQLYGQTEVPMCISALRKVDHDPADAEAFGSAGLPCPMVQVRLFDSEMNEVSAGEAGEICVRSPLVMDGYWDREQVTEETWRGGWHHTGDVAVLTPRGYLRIVDRTNDMIISGGYNIYPREVEDALSTHVSVSASAVVGLPDAKWGEAVTAFVVLRPGAAPTAKILQEHVRELRGPAWTPKAVHFVDHLPVTPLGKIDRKALRQSAGELL